MKIRRPDTRTVLRPLPSFLCGALVFLLVAPLAAAADTREPGPLRAGAATSNITPPLGSLMVGGFAPSPSQHIADELHARCVVLDDGVTRIAFVICDNLGIPRPVLDDAKRRIEQTTGLAPGAVVIAATHTHSGPNLGGSDAPAIEASADAYRAFVITRIADGVRRAIHHLEPARIAWGKAQLPNQVFNRRWLMKSKDNLRNPFGGIDQARTNPPTASPDLLQPAGPTDPEIGFFSIQATNGRPIALLANYSLHYVGGERPGQVTADYFGAFADRIQQLLGADRIDPPFVGIMSNGTSGDVTNVDRAAADPRKYQPGQKLRFVANEAARVVHQASQGLVWHDRVKLGVTYRELELKKRNPSSEELARARALLERPPPAGPLHARELEYARRTVAMAEAPEHAQFPVQVFRIGDLAIASIAAETFAEIGLELKAQSRFEMMFTMALANGFFGYLPTPRQHALGGYETWLGTNRLEVDASKKIISALAEMMTELR